MNNYLCGKDVKDTASYVKNKLQNSALMLFLF